MNNKQFERFLQLSQKMTDAAKRLGVEYTDTANLSDSERYEWRKLRNLAEQANLEFQEQQRIKAGPQFYPSYT